MQPFKTLNRDTSVLRSQLLALGLEAPQSKGEENVAVVTANDLAAIPLRPLTLPAAAPSLWHQIAETLRPLMSQSVPALALCAMVMLTFATLKHDREPTAPIGIRSKGTSAIWLYWERQGHVTVWQPGTKLHNGDRIRMEIMSHASSTATWGVMNHDLTLLQSADDIKANIMSVAPGESKPFGGSVKLVGTAEGETIFVILCSNSRTPSATASLSQALDIMNKGQFNAELLPKTCEVAYFRLR